MSTFSTIACYAALNAISDDDFVKAYAKVVASLIQQKRYIECKADVMCKDFKDYYGFELPYHPMITIINECINLGYLSYNESTHQLLPNYEMIDHEDYMQIVEEKDSMYQTIKSEFKAYLIEHYKCYASDEDIDERIQAFIERYGIETQIDKKKLHIVKDDCYFADYLVYCEENDKEEILDYLNEYTIGLSLSELFVYCEKPVLYTSKGTKVYLDTGIVFKLFGIDSTNRQDSYISFLKNIQHMGMKVYIYEHTLNEIIGIIENSKEWIGNIYFDPVKASEATNYFIRNSWKEKEIDDFSSMLQYRLQAKFNISIDYEPYPKSEDIVTIHEADINELIKAEYADSGSSIYHIEGKEYSIEQDARSIFLTQHKNGRTVPYHINEVKHIFITTNRSLARVGYKIASEYYNPRELLYSFCHDGH